MKEVIKKYAIVRETTAESFESELNARLYELRDLAPSVAFAESGEYLTARIEYKERIEATEDAPSFRYKTEVFMNNKIIRISMLENGLSQWELAKILGISESQMSRKLREELPEDEQKRIVSIIEKGGESDDV